MFVKLFLINFVFVIASAAECDPLACPPPLTHYKNLGCKPIIPPGECCVQRYECEEKYMDVSKCHLNGNSFEVGTSIPETELKGLCVSSCSCVKNKKAAEFQCGISDCLEFFERYSPNCIRQEDLNSCCAKNTICDKEEIDKLATCYFRNVTYREGESMYDMSMCHQCICAPNFDNNTIIGNPNCKENTFTEMLLHAPLYRMGCIPVYRGTSLSCNWSWKCPKDTDKLIPAEGRKPEIENDPKLTCKFGKLNLKLGDGIGDTHNCTECKCVIPPMAHCIETDCDVPVKI